MAKRDITKPEHAVKIPPPKGKQNEQEKPDPKREWEATYRHSDDYCQLSFRRIPHQLRERLKEIAEHHEVPVEQVGRLFLEYAVSAYDADHLPIEPVLERGRLKIFRDWE